MNKTGKKNLILRYLFVVIFLFFILIKPDTIYATNTKEEKLKDLKNKETKYRNLIDLKKTEETVIKHQIKELESQSKELETNIEKNKEKVRKVESEIQKVKNKIAKKNVVLHSQKELLKKILLSKYQTASYDNSIKRLFSPSSSEAFASSDRIEQTASKIHDMVSLMTKEQIVLKKNVSELEDRKNDVKNVQFDLNEQNLQLESTKNYKTFLAQKTSAEKRSFENKLDEVLMEQLQVQNEINSLSTAQIGTFSLSDLPSKKEANMINPVKKPFVITQGYGKTSYSHHYKGGHHNGIDFAARGSKSILAASDGVITATGNMGRYGYGHWIAIDHLNGLVTLYGHLSIVGVSKGMKVKKGAHIGIMGTTGFSTGVHLHFSVFAQKTFRIIESTKVKGLYIPSGGTVNPAMYL